MNIKKNLLIAAAVTGALTAVPAISHADVADSARYAAERQGCSGKDEKDKKKDRKKDKKKDWGEKKGKEEKKNKEKDACSGKDGCGGRSQQN